MRLLLDTQVLLWLLGEPAKIGRRHLTTLADPGNDVHVSAVSTWEVAIKVEIGKLKLPDARDVGVYLPTSMQRAGLTPLPITPEHTYGVASLPRHHGDPFDRLLVAQARVADMTIVTSDRHFLAYEVPTIMIR